MDRVAEFINDEWVIPGFKYTSTGWVECINHAQNTPAIDDMFNPIGFTHMRPSEYLDPLTHLKGVCRSRTYQAFKGNGFSKDGRTHELIGCSYIHLMKYIEQMFSHDMDWNNMGGVWHIDHRIPFASADNKDELIALCHYTNLQPMLAFDNLSKGAKYCQIEKEQFLKTRI